MIRFSRSFRREYSMASHGNRYCTVAVHLPRHSNELSVCVGSA